MKPHIELAASQFAVRMRPSMTTCRRVAAPCRYIANPRCRRPRSMDFEHARFNMVEQQIRTWDVLDQDVLDLLFR